MLLRCTVAAASSSCWHCCSSQFELWFPLFKQSFTLLYVVDTLDGSVDHFFYVEVSESRTLSQINHIVDLCKLLNLFFIDFPLSNLRYYNILFVRHEGNDTILISVRTNLLNPIIQVMEAVFVCEIKN